MLPKSLKRNKKIPILLFLISITIILIASCLWVLIVKLDSLKLSENSRSDIVSFYILLGASFSLLIVSILYYHYNIKQTYRVAYLAGGCFWCASQVFYGVKGVLKVTSGYMGGDVENPTYDLVKEGETGHLETVRIEYDSSIISYKGLLDIYFDNIEPLNDQGQYIDVGSNYLLAIFVNGLYQRIIANMYCRKVEKKLGQKLAVSIRKKNAFYFAEEEHQDYHIKNPEAFEEELAHSGRKKKEKGVFSQAEKYYKIIKNNGEDFNIIEITQEEYENYFERN